MNCYRKLNKHKIINSYFFFPSTLSTSDLAEE